MELLERDAYLEQLEDHLRQAAAGHGRVVLVGGEAGVGKTALVDEFCLRSREAAEILRTSCDALSTPGPLGPLRDLAPALGLRIDRSAADSEGRDLLFRSTLAAYAARSGTTVMVGEDAHWADGASLELLRFLARRIGELRVLFVVTYRDDELGPDHPLRLSLGDLATTATVYRMHLAPLSEDAVHDLAQGSGRDAASLYQLTGGNPFFLHEVLAAEGEGVPASVGDAVLARAARLSAEARAVLDVAAAIGSSVDTDLLAEVAGPVLDHLDECVARGLLRIRGDGLTFSHDLTREAILAAIPPPRRRLLHVRVLAALREREGDNKDLALLAHHAEAAGDRDAVILFAVAAAEQAAAAHAHREAAAQYARALRFADELPLEQIGALLDARSRECQLSNQLNEGIEACQAAVDVWRQVGDRLKEGDAQRRLSRLYWFFGRNADAETAARAALDVLGTLPPSPELAMAYSNLSGLRLNAWDWDEAIAWGNKAIALAERFGESETLVHALNNVGSARFVTDEEQARNTVERSLYLALESGLEEHAARAYVSLGTAYADMFQFGRALPILEEGIAYCAERDLDHMRSYLVAWQALSLLYLGHWTEAAELAGSVERQAGAPPVSRIMALVALGRVRARHGEPEAGTVLDEALALAVQTGELQRLGPVRIARAEAAWLAGDRDRLLAETRELHEVMTRYDHRWFAGEVAFWLWRVGELNAPPPDMFEPFALQIAGKWAEAADHWRTLGCPYEAASALADGDESSMRDAYAEFTRLGAAPAAAIVTQQLREIGVRSIPRGPHPTTQANPALLTRREMEVLALLAEGLPNAEIAHRLYLAPKTVSHHVSAILAKLHVQNRAEATRAATRLGLVAN